MLGRSGVGMVRAMSGPPSPTKAHPLTWDNRVGTRLRAAVGCGAVGVALVACTGPGGAPSPDSTRPAPSVTASSPTPAPSSSAPPERPAAMERRDVEGAIAAAQYFLELYPYVYNTGDLTEWRAMSHPDCVFCASVVKNVEELHAAGGYETGGGFQFESVSAQEPLPDNEFFGVDLAAIQAPGSRHDSAGRVVDAGPRTRLAIFTALQDSGPGWVMRAVTIEDRP